MQLLHCFANLQNLCYNTFMMQEICNLCPRGCGIDRSEKRGFCQTAERIRIARADLHFYEEPVISGTRGSGAIFFCGCSLRCCFCQNFSVSRNTVGSEISEKRLSELFRELEDKGAHNINLVNPTHLNAIDPNCRLSITRTAMSVQRTLRGFEAPLISICPI